MPLTVFTAIGTGLDIHGLLSPSLPKELEPQAAIAPSELSAKLCELPAAMVTTALP